jgi:hypothetical protein
MGGASNKTTSHITRVLDLTSFSRRILLLFDYFTMHGAHLPINQTYRIGRVVADFRALFCAKSCDYQTNQSHCRAKYTAGAKLRTSSFLLELLHTQQKTNAFLNLCNSMHTFKSKNFKKIT